jgi:hypothetical protein
MQASQRRVQTPLDKKDSSRSFRSKNGKEGPKRTSSAAWEGVLPSTSPNRGRSFENLTQNWRSSSRKDVYDTESEEELDEKRSVGLNRSSVSFGLNKSFPWGSKSEMSVQEGSPKRDRSPSPLRSYSKFDQNYNEFLKSSKLIHNTSNPNEKRMSEFLIEKIKSGSYVDFADFLPHNILEYTAWDNKHVSRTVDGSSAPKVTDFAEWIQCMMLYISILCQEYPERIADLLGYVTNIAMLYQESDEKGAWLRYDEAFRRKASLRRLTTWSKWDKELWVLASSSEARRNVSCRSCLTSMHDEESCPFSQQAVEFDRLRKTQSQEIERLVATSVVWLGFHCHIEEKCFQFDSA